MGGGQARLLSLNQIAVAWCAIARVPGIVFWVSARIVVQDVPNGTACGKSSIREPFFSALLSLIAASAAVCDCNGFKSDGEKMPTTVDRIIWLFDA